jgi:hypothetical protein
MSRQRGQRLPRRERESRADVERERELIVAVQLHLVRAIERQRAPAERAEVADVAAITELRHANRAVARIVGREIVDVIPGSDWPLSSRKKPSNVPRSRE